MKKCRSIRLVLGFTVVTVLGAALPAAAKQTPPSCSSNVSTIIAGADSNNVPFQLQSDGKGAYVNFTNSKTDYGTDEIVSGSCNYELSLQNSQSRTLTLTFEPSTGAPFAGPLEVSTPHIYSYCSNNPANNGLDYGNMTFTGQTMQCQFLIGFQYNGTQYSVRMNPNLYSGTDWVNVQCTGASGGVCNMWSVTPIPGSLPDPSTGQPSAIGGLFKMKNGNIESSLGLYYFDFALTITK